MLARIPKRSPTERQSRQGRCKSACKLRSSSARPWTESLAALCFRTRRPSQRKPVALVDVQLRVALFPLVTALGPTLKLRVGAALLIETATDCAAVPPGP